MWRNGLVERRNWVLKPSDSPTLTPILDEKNRIVDEHFHPESKFLPVSEPDLSHLELRNLIDAYLSTWISSIGLRTLVRADLCPQGRAGPWLLGLSGRGR